VVSLWAGGTCRGSFRLAAGDVDRMVAVLRGVELPLPEQTVEPAQPETSEGPQTSEGTANRGTLPAVPRLQVA
jgi:hypothetical protein